MHDETFLSPNAGLPEGKREGWGKILDEAVIRGSYDVIVAGAGTVVETVTEGCRAA